MIVHVRLFAVARQAADREMIELDLPEGATIAALRAALVQAIPELERLKGHLLFAIDTQYADEKAVIAPGADVACIPPVSGG